MAEAAEQLIQTKAESWLSAEVRHSNDSIKEVVRYFKKQTENLTREKPVNKIVDSLMRDNWKLQKGPMVFPIRVFFKSEELPDIRSVNELESTLGVVPFDDFIVRVHLMSPHPDGKPNRVFIPGTMITIIKERMPQEIPVSATVDGAYTGAEVTTRARIKNKPEPDHPGGMAYPVILKCIFAANGKVASIRITQGRAEDVFTQAAIKAARRITFEPAIKDGRYVSQWVQLEYYFH